MFAIRYSAVLAHNTAVLVVIVLARLCDEIFNNASQRQLQRTDIAAFVTTKTTTTTLEDGVTTAAIHNATVSYEQLLAGALPLDALLANCLFYTVAALVLPGLLRATLEPLLPHYRKHRLLQPSSRFSHSRVSVRDTLMRRPHTSVVLETRPRLITLIGVWKSIDAVLSIVLMCVLDAAVRRNTDGRKSAVFAVDALGMVLYPCTSENRPGSRHLLDACTLAAVALTILGMIVATLHRLWYLLLVFVRVYLHRLPRHMIDSAEVLEAMKTKCLPLDVIVAVIYLGDRSDTDAVMSMVERVNLDELDDKPSVIEVPLDKLKRGNIHV